MVSERHAGPDKVQQGHIPTRQNPGALQGPSRGPQARNPRDRPSHVNLQVRTNGTRRCRPRFENARADRPHGSVEADPAGIPEVEHPEGSGPCCFSPGVPRATFSEPVRRRKNRRARTAGTAVRALKRVEAWLEATEPAGRLVIMQEMTALQDLP